MDNLAVRRKGMRWVAVKVGYQGAVVGRDRDRGYEGGWTT